MFKRLFGSVAAPEVPALDTHLAQDDLALRAACNKIVAGEWEVARDLMLEVRGDWERWGRRLTVLSTLAGNGNWLDRWLYAEPTDGIAAVIDAERRMDEAGEARGGASAAHTSQEQFARFADLSKVATSASERAIALAPQDPTPWVTLMYSYLSGGRRHLAEFAHAFEEGKRRDPHNFELHLAALTFYCQKWYGSHEQMFAVARSLAGNPGSPGPMLVHLAHFEYAMREFGWDQRSDRSRKACGKYLARPEVQRELDAAVAAWRAGGPRPTGRSMTCRHWQAIAYVLTGRRAEARAVLTEIGPYLGSTAAWGYFWWNDVEGYTEAWKWAFGR